MTTSTLKPIENMVQLMRQVTDEISNEIKDMTFAEERVFLNKLLNNKRQKEKLKSK